MTQLRVLFVDDDELVLSALRRRLRRSEPTWETVFVTSAAAALDELARAAFHVVVSDMRMPGMSGAELLEQVMRDHPTIGRVGLTGYFDEVDLVGRGIAHVMLGKPCEHDVLRTTITSLCPGGERAMLGV